MELAEWVRRRVRLYYPPSRSRYGGTRWKQWKQPRTRRRHLIALGIAREEVHMATRSRKGYWRMSANSIVQRALTNRWLHEQGVPDLSRRSPQGEDGYAQIMDHSSLRAGGPCLIGTARCGPACRVVWEPRLALQGSVGATRLASTFSENT